jgi:hypothetical protein
MSEELQDEVRAAMEEVSKKEDDAPAVGTTEVEAAAKLEPEPEKAPEPVKAEEAAPATDDRILTEDKAPRGWSPAAREKWSTIPDDLRQEILRREDASAAGVRQLQERYQPMENFVRGIAPILQEAQQHGVNADQYINQVMGTERVLRTADVPGRFQAILAIADQYGVPLRDIINESVGQKVVGPAASQQMQVPPQIMQELQEMRQWRQQMDSTNTNGQIEEFAKNNEFFDDVHKMMAGLIDSGSANGLQDAYEQACWATPAVRDIMLSRQKIQGRQTAAAGASIKPGSSAGVSVPLEEEGDDLEATVRASFARATTGRV